MQYCNTHSSVHLKIDKYTYCTHISQYNIQINKYKTAKTGIKTFTHINLKLY